MLKEPTKKEFEFDASDLSYLQGEILTIIDALMPAPESDFVFSTSTSTYQLNNKTQSQNSAAKSLIRAAFGRSLAKFGIAGTN